MAMRSISNKQVSTLVVCCWQQCDLCCFDHTSFWKPSARLAGAAFTLGQVHVHCFACLVPPTYTCYVVAAAAAARPALEARYGSSRQNMTLSISRLLQAGDPDLVGVFAQLGYVDEPRLSAVLAANYCAAMQVRGRGIASRGS